jgi:ATP-binding cassette subfamily F protein uup
LSEKPATKEKVVEESLKKNPPRNKPNKLSYKLQRELEALPGRLEQLETDIETLQEKVNAADFFSQPVEVTQPVLDELTGLENELEVAFERWEELEAMQQEF